MIVGRSFENFRCGRSYSNSSVVQRMVTLPWDCKVWRKKENQIDGKSNHPKIRLGNSQEECWVRTSSFHSRMIVLHLSKVTFNMRRLLNWSFGRLGCYTKMRQVVYLFQKGVGEREARVISSSTWLENKHTSFFSITSEIQSVNTPFYTRDGWYLLCEFETFLLNCN